jgi:hypothetical protein
MKRPSAVLDREGAISVGASTTVAPTQLADADLHFTSGTGAPVGPTTVPAIVPVSGRSICARRGTSTTWPSRSSAPEACGLATTPARFA